ncbi:alternative ribosome rescue aminoacyl-tRNA hydrolase ArfB [Hymenobacter lapidiphilus]|uniref:Aminoacyl-tRNA hydrolase n=1 Tax=Hymenobacter lapidiphilus TaxID=2608003 RepID=A0A7Y7U531_9BACT|nr:alternative ribosome rescue aminoacyl-tRNA hydrolase ArfB [Hymenobacter lapidiphilus]NVO30897.1 aminoacyl-tRNA hydrolase [Hymenobacter lapidiphilus]
MLPAAAHFLPELQFQTSRSSGPGGQNVNKVESRVELRFRIADSQLLSEEQKQTLLEKLASRLTQEGELLVTAQEDRSQLRNRETALLKFHQLLVKTLHRPKTRRPTKPGKGAVRKRLESKKKHGDKKTNRGRVDF